MGHRLRIAHGRDLDLADGERTAEPQDAPAREQVAGARLAQEMDVEIGRDRELDAAHEREHDAVEGDVGERHHRRAADRAARAHQHLAEGQAQLHLPGFEPLDPDPEQSDIGHAFRGQRLELFGRERLRQDGPPAAATLLRHATSPRRGRDPATGGMAGRIGGLADVPSGLAGSGCASVARGGSMASADPLLQPYRLRHLTLRNRVMSTSHEPFYSEDGLPKERYRLYHVEKAKGGLALTMIGGSSIVAPDSPPAFGNLHLYKDEIVPWFRELADAVHEHGCAVMCQITHLGRRSSNYTGDWLPLVWPSPLREPAHRSWPKAMEDFDFERVIRAYAEGAERCRAGGLDGIEIEAYGHLFDAFWSPAWNRRTDEWGGSLENRMRFSLMVIEAIREAVGPDFIVGIRMVLDEHFEGGLSREEGLEIARRLFATGKLDFLNVIRGHIESDAALAEVIPNMGTPTAPHLAFAGEVKRALGPDVPVFHAARINDVATARFAVREGLLDMVGMTRAHIADPHIVAKIARGEEHRIRPCVGAGYCIDRIYGEGEALCIHNPATGREKTIPQVIAKGEGPRRRVVVVGAGPAGLEAARVSAERGHEVIVLEAAGDPGGQIRLSMALDRRIELVGIVDWRVGECERLGVEFRYNCYAEADDVRALEPDIVVVATGGLPNTSFLVEGEEHATTSWDILSGAARPAEQVLLYDDNGAHPGLVTAEVIARAGAQLEYVTPERMFAPLVGGTNYPAYVDAFTRHGVRVTLFERLVRVHRRGNKLEAEFWNEFARRHTLRLVDQVVVEHGTLPNDELYFALKPESVNGGEIDQAALLAGRPQQVVRNPDGRFRLYRIGDAVASRNIHAAVLDAVRLCMAF